MVRTFILQGFTRLIMAIMIRNVYFLITAISFDVYLAQLTLKKLHRKIRRGSENNVKTLLSTLSWATLH